MKRRSYRQALAIASVMTLVAAVLLAPTSASAALTSCNSPHCYAVYSNGATIGGNYLMKDMGGDLEIDCLAVHNIASQWANNELWFDTSSNASTYVEEGFKAGSADLSGGVEHNGFQFWWDDNNGSREYDHFIRWATSSDIGVYRNVSFYWVSGHSYSVWLAGSKVGTSTVGADSVAHGMSSGVEEAQTSTAQAWTHVENLQYYYSGSSWHPLGGLQDYRTAGSNLSLSSLQTSGGLPHFSVSTPNYRCGTPPTSLTVPHGQPVTAAGAQQAALVAARPFGAGSTELVQEVQSTRSAAVHLNSNDEIATSDANDKVYVVQFNGNFTGQSSLPGKSPLTGHVLQVSVDAATGQVVDTTLMKSTSTSLATLGPVTAATVTSPAGFSH